LYLINAGHSVASVTFNYEGEIKQTSTSETLYTSYKNAYAMTQEIKNFKP
jgi:hypothetical protein